MYIHFVIVLLIGPRGAFAICLALITENTADINISQTEKSRILFYVGGIAALTLIFNANLSLTILKFLNLVGTDGHTPIPSHETSNSQELPEIEISTVEPIESV